eukprot:scaffold1397_cov254-Pinguiococcus_pyrenoidosus.AAC.7
MSSSLATWAMLVLPTPPRSSKRAWARRRASLRRRRFERGVPASRLRSIWAPEAPAKRDLRTGKPLARRGRAKCRPLGAVQTLAGSNGEGFYFDQSRTINPVTE